MALRGYPKCPLAEPFGPGSPLGAAVRDLHPGLAAATQSIQIFATCLIPFIHPVMAAKMVATVDHISGGRMELNATAGYFKPEFNMFGMEIAEHGRRSISPMSG
ncbi:LLM class flavin-dependent oxidoreductase [Pseudarthrobacter siccitolerans]|nr:LLM class flavin-dependent oxidoreductase [Pseudarthrobacter siccitolerans]